MIYLFGNSVKVHHNPTSPLVEQHVPGFFFHLCDGFFLSFSIAADYIICNITAVAADNVVVAADNVVVVDNEIRCWHHHNY